jgi:predicted Zn-dependent protease
MALVRAMEKETPGGSNALYHRAYVLASAKKVPEALEALRSLLKEFPAWQSMLAKEAVFEELLKDKALAEPLADAKEKSAYDEAVRERDPEGTVSLSQKRLERAPDVPKA